MGHTATAFAARQPQRCVCLVEIGVGVDVDVDVFARSPEPEASIADLLAELKLVPWDIAAIMPGMSCPAL